MAVYRKAGNDWITEPPMRGSWWVRLEAWIRRMLAAPPNRDVM